MRMTEEKKKNFRLTSPGTHTGPLETNDNGRKIQAICFFFQYSISNFLDIQLTT